MSPTIDEGDLTMEITYTKDRNYLVPKHGLPEQADHTLPDKYGSMMHQYLKDHRPILWKRMILDGTLFIHLLQIDRAAYDWLEHAKAAKATAAFKSTGPMKQVELMNTCKASA